MPGNILNMDTMFPSFRDDETSEQKLDKVTNYLYMLLEQLRYTLNNLDSENFNDTGLREIGDGIRASFEDDLAKTEAVIEAWANATEAGFREVAEWQSQTNESISSISGKADANAASITLLNQWKGETSSSLAAVQVKASQNESQITALVDWRNTAEDDIDGLSETMAVIEATADENGARIDQIVSAIGKDGEVTFASIAAGVADDESFIELIAERVDISGFVTFESLENDGEATVNGNNVSLISDSDGESISKISYYFGDHFGDSSYEIGTIYSEYDEDWGYALCVSANYFKRSSSRWSDAYLKLRGEGGVIITSVVEDIVLSSGSGIAMYGQTYCDIGAGYSGVRIRADSDYRDTIESNPGPNTFIFVNGGLYYIDDDEDPHVVWEL